MSGSMESVLVLDFWATYHHGRAITFHAGRRDGAYGVRCHRMHPQARRSALPRSVAEQIARPCSRCYPDETSSEGRQVPAARPATPDPDED